MITVNPQYAIAFLAGMVFLACLTLSAQALNKRIARKYVK